MSNLGSLHFQIHLQDFTDAEADKIKKKLENLQVKLNIDASSTKVSNTDAIKRQIESAVNSINIGSVKLDASAVKQQIEAAAQTAVPAIKVTLLHGSLSNDIQNYLNAKSFNISVTISQQQLQGELSKITATVPIPVVIKVDKKVALDSLKQSLQNISVPIGIKMKSSKELTKDISERMKNASVKVGIDVNRNTLRSNVSKALKDQTFKAKLDFVVQKASVQSAIRQAFAKAGLNYETTASDNRQNMIDTRNLKTEAYVKAQRALEELRRAQAESARAADKQNASMGRVNKTAEKQQGIMKSLREQVANAYALYRVGRFLENTIRISGEFQQQHVALQTILGDAEKADVLFTRIKDLAVESPFKFGDLTKYAKQLAAFSIPYEELFDTLRRFGDLSAGLGVDMGRIILAYGQVRSAEFLKGTELRQFTEAGIPLVTELARRYSELEGTLVSVGDVYDRISRKEIPFSDVKDVLWDLTNEGGRFFNLQAKLTDTLKGKLDKLIDSYEIFLSEVGNSNNEVLGGALDLLTDVLDHWRLLQDAVVGAGVAYGSYRVALMAVNAVQRVSFSLNTIQAIINATRATQGLAAATKLAALAQYALNTAMKANPFVLAATAIGSIIGLYVTFRESTESASESLSRINSEMLDFADKSEQQRIKGERLVSIMKDEKRSVDERREAYNELNRMFPSIFGNMNHHQVLLLKEKRLHEMVGEAARKSAMDKSKATIDEEEVKLRKLKAEYDKQQKYFDDNLAIRGYKDSHALKAAREAYQEQLEVVNSAKDAYNEIFTLNKKIEESQKSWWYKGAKDIADASGFKSLVPTDKEYDFWQYFDRIKQGMDDVQGRIDNLQPDTDAYKKLFPDLDKELKAYEKVYYGVLGGKNEEVLKAAEEARKQREKQLQDEAKRNEKLGREAAKAFAEGVRSEMDRIASQWDLYKQLFEATGDKDFASTAFQNTQVWDEAAHQMLEKLKEVSPVKEDWYFDFKISDEEAKTVYGPLYDGWKQIKDYIEKNGIDLKLNVSNVLKKYKDERLSIEEEFNKDIELLESSRTKGNSSEIDKAIARAKKMLNEALQSLYDEEAAQASKDSGFIKMLFGDISSLSFDALGKFIAQARQLRDYLDGKGDKEGITFISAEQLEAIEKSPEEIDKLRKALDKLLSSGKGGEWSEIFEGFKTGFASLKSAEGFKDITESVGGIVDSARRAISNLSDMFKEMGEGEVADVLNDINDLMGSVVNIGKGFKDGGVVGGIVAVIGEAVKYIGKAVSANKRHHSAMQSVMEQSIQQQREYNLLLSEQNLLYEQASTIFGTDLYRKASNAAIVLRDANEALRNELKNLADVEIVTGHKKTGLFGWGSGKDTYSDILEVYPELIDQSGNFNKELAETILSTRKMSDEHAATLQYLIDLSDQVEEAYAEMKEYLTGIFGDLGNSMMDAMVEAFDSGTDAASKFLDSISDMLNTLAKQMVYSVTLAPVISEAQEKMMNIAKHTGMNDEAKFNAYTEVMNGLLNDALAEQDNAAKLWEKYKEMAAEKGFDISTEESDSSSGGLSKGIQGVTEDTANLLASYINQIRADVSIKRSLVEKLIGEDVPKMNYLAEAQLAQLNQITQNTKRNADTADRIFDLVNRVIDKGSNKLRV